MNNIMVVSSSGILHVDRNNGQVLGYEQHPGAPHDPESMEGLDGYLRFDIDEYCKYYGVEDRAAIDEIDILDVGGVMEDGSTFTPSETHRALTRIK